MAQAPYSEGIGLPRHRVGEVIAGTLYVSPLLPPIGALAKIALIEVLGPPTRSTWQMLMRCELQLGDDIVVADLAAWCDDDGIAPNWVCEVLAPSTAKLDRTKKLGVYARERVTHVWIIDPLSQTLEVLRLDGDTYRIAMTAGGEDKVRAEPFDAIELDLAILWAR
ncbi:MAG TPA: Uma2 family endonuclease [Kofleriaceae bacterium]|nr:Uma2 family endonuclease [Kofleriaceae bacterium]